MGVRSDPMLSFWEGMDGEFSPQIVWLMSKDRRVLDLCTFHFSNVKLISRFRSGSWPFQAFPIPELPIP